MLLELEHMSGSPGGLDSQSWDPTPEILIQQVWGGAQECAFEKQLPGDADAACLGPPLRTRALNNLVCACGSATSHTDDSLPWVLRPQTWRSLCTSLPQSPRGL